MLGDTLILSVENLVSAPLATRLLRDLGAEVIKVENPDGGDYYRHSRQFYDDPNVEDLTYVFLQHNKGKQSIVLDLKSAEGKDIFRELAEQADVIVENLRAGAMDRLGLGYTEMVELNEDIIYCSISGFGRTGPYADMGAVDPILQVMSGLVDQNQSFAGHPTLSGIFVADFVSSLFATISILAALNRGESTHIDLSMMDALISLMHSEAGEYSATGTAPPRQRNTSVPQGLYETSDGSVCLLVRGGKNAWTTFCTIMGFDDWVETGEFNTLDDRQDKDGKRIINERIQRALRQETSETWVNLFEEENVYLVPVRSVDEVFEDDATTQRGLLREAENEALGEYNWLDFPAIFSNFETSDESAPRLGEHTTDILSQLGYSEEEIKTLYDDGVMGASGEYE